MVDAIVDWLNKNRGTLLARNRDDVLHQVRTAMNAILPETNVEVSKDGGDTEIVISSLGEPHLTREMLAASANIVSAPHWRVLMPAPPRGFRFKFSRGGVRVDVAQAVFEPLRAEGREAIGVGVAGLELLSRDDALTVARAGVGDVLFSLVEFWDFDWPPTEGALPISDLAEYIQWANSKRKRSRGIDTDS